MSFEIHGDFVRHPLSVPLQVSIGGDGYCTARVWQGDCGNTNKWWIDVGPDGVSPLPTGVSSMEVSWAAERRVLTLVHKGGPCIDRWEVGCVN